MSTSTALTVEQSQAANELRDLNAELYKLGHKALKVALKIGEKLTECRNDFPSGGWLDFLTSTGIPQKSAWRYMTLWDKRELVTVTNGDGDVSLTDAYKLAGIIKEVKQLPTGEVKSEDKPKTKSKPRDIEAEVITNKAQDQPEPPAQEPQRKSVMPTDEEAREAFTPALTFAKQAVEIMYKMNPRCPTMVQALDLLENSIGLMNVGNFSRPEPSEPAPTTEVAATASPTPAPAPTTPDPDPAWEEEKRRMVSGWENAPVGNKEAATV